MKFEQKCEFMKFENHCILFFLNLDFTQHPIFVVFQYCGTVIGLAFS